MPCHWRAEKSTSPVEPHVPRIGRVGKSPWLPSSSEGSSNYVAVAPLTRGGPRQHPAGNRIPPLACLQSAACDRDEKVQISALEGGVSTPVPWGVLAPLLDTDSFEKLGRMTQCLGDNPSIRGLAL